ncbi:hypothetical protein AAK967_02945 [Atopobiaceae bacterium 24-176]
MARKAVPLVAVSFALALAVAGPAAAAEAAPLRPASNLAAPADESLAALSEGALYASSIASGLDAASVKDPATYCDLEALLAQANRDAQALSRRGSDGVGASGCVSRVMDAQRSCDLLRAAADAAKRSADEKAADERAAQEKAAQERAAWQGSRGVQASGSATASGPRAASGQAAEAAGEGGGAGDGAWNVSYRNEYGAAEGAADGACTQWADGYYVAHDWSESGAQIASKPNTVVVDGQRYAYAGSMVVPEGSDYYGSGAYDFTHADGGIGFQTCCDGGYLITHYVPY